MIARLLAKYQGALAVDDIPGGVDGMQVCKCCLGDCRGEAGLTSPTTTTTHAPRQSYLLDVLRVGPVLLRRVITLCGIKLSPWVLQEADE